jgi:hypothetical protein
LLHGYMVLAYVGKGMYPEAFAELQKGLALSGAGPPEMAVLAHIRARMGDTAEGRALLSQLLSRGDVPAYYIAEAYLGFGDKDRAFTWLEKALRERTGPFNELSADPMFDSLRDDPLFAALLRRMGLPAAHTASG